MEPAPVQSSEATAGSIPPPLPLDSAVRRRRFWGMVLGGIPLLLLGIWLVRTFEPAGQPFYPRCQFHAVTGLQCPGCGSTRAVHHLLNGDVLGSLRSNALLLLLWCPLAVTLAWKSWPGHRLDRVVNGRSVVALLVLLGLFFLFRNLPGPARVWLNPPPPSIQ